MIPSETVTLVRERVDIVEVIGDFVELRRAGANYKGLCPFHQEKTPSFNVNPARQIFHCFGCGAGGDVFTFLMNYEGRTFMDTVRTLADRVNVQIEERNESPAARDARHRERNEKERLVVVVERTALFYCNQLRESAGARARAYLKNRDIGEKICDSFAIGYAPAQWDALTKQLYHLGITPSEAERVGLIVPRKDENGYYDRFRDRIIFPIHDAVGRVIALAGRVLPDAPEDAPKYVNSPESPIFSKSRSLYGLHRAREAFRRQVQPILVEGNLDVITMHSQGFTSTVAPMGTALTAEQVNLMRRFAGRQASVTLLFDGDEAGRQAALRSHSALTQGGLGAKVAFLPPNEDPDSFLRREGISALEKILAGAEGLVEHLIDEAAKRAGSDAHSIAQSIRSLAPVIAAVSDHIEQDLYRKLIAKAFGVAEDVVFRYLRSKDTIERKEQREARPGARRRAEGMIAGALLDYPELIEEAVQAEVLNYVTDRTVRWVLERIREVAVGQRAIDSIAEIAPDPRLKKRLRARLVSPKNANVDNARREVFESLKRLRELMEKEQGEELQKQAREAGEAGDEDRAVQLRQKKLIQKRQSHGLAPDGNTGR